MAFVAGLSPGVTVRPTAPRFVRRASRDPPPRGALRRSAVRPRDEHLGRQTEGGRTWGVTALGWDMSTGRPDGAEGAGPGPEHRLSHLSDGDRLEIETAA